MEPVDQPSDETAYVEIIRKGDMSVVDRPLSQTADSPPTNQTSQMDARIQEPSEKLTSSTLESGIASKENAADADSPQATSMADEGLPPDHPQGAKIRKQVEYYFSDGNLANDKYLLDKCGGRTNLPVSLKSICGFPKMRKFRPYSSVVAALKRSHVLVVEGKKIRRRVPLRGPTINDPPDGEDSDFEDVIEEKVEAEELKKSRDPPSKIAAQEDDSGLSKNALKPTGFEAFYADAPTTPWDAQEEQEHMYRAEMTFETRIEIAIHRYRQRRKFRKELAPLFDRWMKFGGVEHVKMQYTGDTKSSEFHEYSKPDQILLTCQYHVGHDKTDDEWVVDFAGVARGFLSYHLVGLLWNGPEELTLVTTMFRNFYNYLLMHDVCPEYRDDILEAKKVCDVAEQELETIARMRLMLPGYFAHCCSMLFDPRKRTGSEFSVFDQNDLEGAELIDVPTARIIFRTGLATMASAELWEQVQESGEQFFEDITVNRSLGTKGLEIVEIHRPSKETMALVATEFAHRLPISPLGKIVCKEWAAPSIAEVDTAASAAAERKRWASMSKGQQEMHLKRHHGRWLEPVIDSDKRYELWLEDSLLRYLKPGTKIEAGLSELSIGILFMTRVDGVYSTFFEFLPNELEMGRSNNHAKNPKFKKDKQPEGKKVSEEVSEVEGDAFFSDEE